MSGRDERSPDPGASFAGVRLWSLALFWLGQLVVQAALVLLFVASSDLVGGSDRPLYPAPTVGHVLNIATEPEAALTIGGVLVAIAACQFGLLWPVRRPSFRADRGWPLRLSLAVGGLAVGVLAAALLFAVLGFVDEALDVRLPDLPEGTGWLIVAVVVGVPWALTSLLLWRFSASGSREGLLARFSARLFLGTMIEVAAIIPLDVMIRRKTSCYCFAGSFVALCICGSVGFFAAGPAILLPILARRRKRWYAGRCDACGYDMSRLPGADRCPECGAGWRPATTPAA